MKRMATRQTKARKADPDHEKWLNEYRHERAFSPAFNASAAAYPFLEQLYGNDTLNLTDLTEVIRKSCATLTSDTPTKDIEEMLMSQAHILNTMFTALLRKGESQEYLKQWESHLRLALKAQSQCKATLETLANIKQPRQLVLAQQANIATQQQVNNGPAVVPEKAAAKALEHQEGEALPCFGEAKAIQSA